MTTWIKQNATFNNILKIMVIIFVTGGMYTTWLFSQQVDELKTQHIALKEDFDEHILESKSQPMTTHEITSQVVEHENEIDKLENEDQRQALLINTLVTNQNILVSNDTRKTDALSQMAEDIGKIKGKLDIK